MTSFNNRLLLHDSTVAGLDSCSDVSQKFTLPAYFPSIEADIEKCKKDIKECCQKMQGRIHNVAPINVHAALYETIYTEDNAYIDKLLQAYRHDMLYLVITIWLCLATHFTSSRFYANTYFTALKRIGLTSWNLVDRRIMYAIVGEGYECYTSKHTPPKTQEMEYFASDYLYEIATIWNYIDTYMMYNI